MQKMLIVLLSLGLMVLALVLSQLDLPAAMAAGKGQCPVQLQSPEGEVGEAQGKQDIILVYSAHEITIPRYGNPTPRESIQGAILNFMSLHARISKSGREESFQASMIYTLTLQPWAFAELLSEGRGRRFFVYFADVKESFGGRNLIDPSNPSKGDLFRELVKKAPDLHDGQIQIFLIVDRISSFRDITEPLLRAKANPLVMLAPLLLLDESPFRARAKKEIKGMDLADFWGQIALGMGLVLKSPSVTHLPDNPPKAQERRGRGRPRKDGN